MNYHKSINTLPYWNFLQIRKYDDIRYLFELDSYLDLSKIKTNESHLKAFNNIMNEYNDMLLKRERASYLFEIDKQIAELEAERYVCLLCINKIIIFKDRKEYKEEVDNAIETLSELGYDYNGNINALQGKIDSILNEIDDLAISKKNTSNINSPSDEAMINYIEKYRKVPINIKQISVIQYLEYENDYLLYVVSMNNKKK